MKQITITDEIITRSAKFYILLDEYQMNIKAEEKDGEFDLKEFGRVAKELCEMQLKQQPL